MNSPEAILSMLMTRPGLLAFAAVVSLLTGIICEIGTNCVTNWVFTKNWWPRAAPLQKALMMNFGYSEQLCTEFSTAHTYPRLIVLSTHHVICGSLMLPVVISGWEAAHMLCQACFVVGSLMEVSLDVYDEFKMVTTTFLFDSVGQKLFGGEQLPKPIFIVVGLLHHPLAIIMVSPLVLYHPDLRSFHVIAMALLFSAGICFTTSSSKFTLDLTKASDGCQFKVIVFVQLVTMLFSRGYIWFYYFPTAVSGFWAKKEMGFFIGGCIVGTLMSLDAVKAAVKWLPRSMVQMGNKEEEALKGIIKGTNRMK